MALEILEYSNVQVIASQLLHENQLCSSYCIWTQRLPAMLRIWLFQQIFCMLWFILQVHVRLMTDFCICCEERHPCTHLLVWADQRMIYWNTGNSQQIVFLFLQILIIILVNMVNLQVSMTQSWLKVHSCCKQHTLFMHLTFIVLRSL